MTRNVVTRALLVLIGGLVTLTALLPIPAQAAGTAIIERDGEPVTITVNGGTLVDVGETVDDVWVLNGRAVIRGQVEGSVIVLNGGASIAGSVGGDVIVVRGGVWVGPESVVRGDVTGSRDVTKTDGAIVEGAIEQISVTGGIQRIIPIFRGALWVGVTVALLGLGAGLMVLVGDTVQRAHQAGRKRPFAAAVRGAGLLIVLPLLALLTFASIIGGLLGLLLVALTALLAVAGLAVTAAGIGRWILPRAPLIAMFGLGALILRVVALVPFFGDLVTATASILGVGALAMAWRNRTKEFTMEAVPAADVVEPTAPALAPIGTTPSQVDVLAGPGVNIDLRPGHQAPLAADDRFASAPVPTPPPTAPAWQDDPQATPEPDGHSWLDRVLADTRTTAAAVDLREAAPTIDLRGAVPTPTDRPPVLQLFSNQAHSNGAGPQIIASVPVREEYYADDPQGPPGNAERRSLFSDRPNTNSNSTSNSNSNSNSTSNSTDHSNRSETPRLFTATTSPVANDGAGQVRHAGPLFTEQPAPPEPAPARSALFAGPVPAPQPDPARMPTSAENDHVTIVRSGQEAGRSVLNPFESDVRQQLFPDSVTASIGHRGSGGRAWRPGQS